jgi:regulation of enolase protein 1 (concanavalin A-like superfamily)
MPFINELPYELVWQNEPGSWSLEPFSIGASAKTDLFVSPQGDVPVLNAPALLFDAPNDFMLSARVTVGFKSAFDAGVLYLYQTDSSWAKLCFEVSPQGDPMVVSVVTKGSSDDCNSVFIQGDSTYLRIAKLANAFAFHHSNDGKYWYFIRTFALAAGQVKAGFVAQSPTGEGCEVMFSEIVFKEETLKDLRSGV